MRSRIRVVPLIPLVLAALLLPLAVAPSTAHGKACGDVSAQGRVWIVGGSGASCGFQRKWTRVFLNHRKNPAGWTCHLRGGSGGCDKNGSDSFFVFYPPD